jgi:hypothetical protein
MLIPFLSASIVATAFAQFGSMSTQIAYLTLASGIRPRSRTCLDCDLCTIQAPEAARRSAISMSVIKQSDQEFEFPESPHWSRMVRRLTPRPGEQFVKRIRNALPIMCQ